MKNIKEARIVKIIHSLEEIIIISVLVVVLILTIINVIYRYIFFSGFLWSDELIGFGMLFIGLIGMATCVRDKLNTSLDGVVSKLPLKVQMVFYFLVKAVVFFTLFYFIYSGFKFLATVGMQKSVVLKWPMRMFYLLIPIGSLLAFFEEVMIMLDDIAHGECRFRSIDEQIVNDQNSENQA